MPHFFFFIILNRGSGENNRPPVSLLHRAVERFRFPAGTGVRPRHTHGRRHDRFSRVADTPEGRPCFPDR